MSTPRSTVPGESSFRVSGRRQPYEGFAGFAVSFVLSPNQELITRSMEVADREWIERLGSQRNQIAPQFDLNLVPNMDPNTALRAVQSARAVEPPSPATGHIPAPLQACQPSAERGFGPPSLSQEALPGPASRIDPGQTVHQPDAAIATAAEPGTKPPWTAALGQAVDQSNPQDAPNQSPDQQNVAQIQEKEEDGGSSKLNQSRNIWWNVVC